MSNITIITNHKGGVEKTTTTVNLAACLTKLGRRVLVVDINTQANCTSHFGIDPEEAHLNAYHTLIEPESDNQENFGSNCFSPIYKNVRSIDVSIKGVPVIELDRSCCTSLDYFRLSHEVIHEL